jgi:hydroxymethylpyrimidine pyrophosphatase-like HAD family hydrolase
MLLRSTCAAIVVALATPMASAQSHPILAKVLEKTTALYNKQKRPIVVFDLDGSLFDNRPRILRILQEFAKEKKYITSDAATKLRALTTAQVQYRLPDTLAAVGITDPAVVQNAAAFWAERFFTDDYLQHDVPTPGSVVFVRTLYSNGARIVYLTGRDAPRQLMGTVKALRDHGLPIGIQGTELIMKPTMQTQDAIFKQQVTNYLRHFGTVVATFDNEPANSNVYRRAFPKATVVLYHAPHKPNPPPLLERIEKLAAFQ